MLKHMFLAQWQVNRLFPVTQSIPHEVQYLVAKQLQNGDTQLERSCWQNYTTIMDWFVFEIHLLWFELAWTHTHTHKSNFPRSVDMQYKCRKYKPLQSIPHHSYLSSILVTCKRQQQAIQAIHLFAPFNQKKSALLVARGPTIDTLLLDSHHPAARTSMAACPYRSGPPGHPHRSPVKRSNDSGRKNHLGEATEATQVSRSS